MEATVGRNQLLADCLQELHAVLILFRQHGFAALRADWMALDAYADKAVVLKLPDTRGVQGVASGVDDTGALLLRDQHAVIHAYSGGEISLRLDRAVR
jgi:BirA family biotin operon repressor/biotin-[acetyl-CoA-carboxylase] ligase